MDIYKICRLCCEKKLRMRQILEENENYPMKQIFYEILRLEVYADDGLPQKICRLCIVTLTKLHSTIESFRANDQMLRKQLLGVVNVEIKEEEEEMDIERLDQPFTQELTVAEDNETLEIQEEIVDNKETDFETEELHEERQQSVQNEESDNITLKKVKMRSKQRSVKRQKKLINSESKPNKRKRGRPFKHGKRSWHIPEFDDPSLPRLNDYKCYICKSDSLGSGDALASHLNTHANEVPQTCTLCVKETVELKSVATLNIHRRMHENPHKCSYCDRRYSSKYVVAQHVQMYHLGDNAPCPSTCNQCGKVCPSKLSLQNHQRIHTSAVACEICGKIYVTKHRLRLHIERAHENAKKYECHECHKKLKSLDSLHVHMKTMHSNEEFKCELCPRSYTTQLTLKAHQKNHEKNPNYKTKNDWKQYYIFLEGEEGIKDGVRLKKCNLCGAITKAIGPHLTAVHFPKELRCELCGKVFKRKQKFEIHMKEHENGKAYRCPICNREFSERKNLILHLKTKQHQDHPLAQSLDWLYEKTENTSSSKYEVKVDYHDSQEHSLDC